MNTHDENELEYTHLEAQYHPIIKFYNFCFFGNGHYIWIPVFWIMVAFTSFLATLTLEEFWTALLSISDMAVLLELCVNISFGYSFCRNHTLAKYIFYFEKQYQLDSKLAIRYFNCCSIILLLCLLYIVILCIFMFQMYYVYVDDQHLMLGEYFGMISTFVIDFTVVGGSLYLCFIWCFQLWILKSCCDGYIDKVITLRHKNTSTSCFLNPPAITSNVINPMMRLDNSIEENPDNVSMHNIAPNDALELIRSSQNGHDFDLDLEHNGEKAAAAEKSNITSTSSLERMSIETNKQPSLQSPCEQSLFPQQQIENALLSYLLEMRKMSDEWFFNHIMRTLTGFGIIAYIAIYIYGSISTGGYLVPQLIFIFVGAVYYLMMWTTALSAGYINDHFFKYTLRKLSSLYAKFTEIDDALDRRIGQTTARIASLRGVDGVHFAGLIMSFEKALSVGSIIASLILFAIHLYYNQL